MPTPRPVCFFNHRQRVPCLPLPVDTSAQKEKNTQRFFLLFIFGIKKILVRFFLNLMEPNKYFFCVYFWNKKIFVPFRFF